MGCMTSSSELRPRIESASTPIDWLQRLLERHEEITADGLQDDVTALLLQAE